MKQGIHPDYVECTVTCTCGNTFTTHSTRKELKVDICNACHPFFTGTQKLIDTGGRVQRFADRFGAGAKSAVAEREAQRKAAAAAKKAAIEEAKKAEREAKAAAKAERAAKYAAEAAKKAAEAPAEPEAVEVEATEEAAE